MKAILTVLAIGMVLMLTGYSLSAQPNLTNGLIAYFPLDGNAHDASGHTNNGTVFGSATFATDRNGVTNACLSLPGTEGVDSGVDVPSLSSLPYGPVTYAAWFLIKAYPPQPHGINSVMTLMGREQCGNQSDGGLVILSDPDYSPSYYNQFDYFTGASGVIVGYSPPTNQWCHVAVTVNTNGATTFYFNGTNGGSGFAPLGGALDFRIGASAAGGCDYGPRYVWNGLIDEVRVYNRVLSSNEVMQLYRLQANGSCTPYAATAVPTVINGFVVGAAVTDSGCGYTNGTPQVLIQDAVGSGASAIAMVTNGSVTQVMIQAAGSNYTSNTTIYIGYPPSINSQPQSQTVNAFGSATFTASAGGLPVPSYQWTMNGVKIPGATTNTLTFSNIVQSNLATYAVIASNVFGTTNSQGAALNMYPYLVTPFGGLDTFWGYTNRLTVQAWGSGPLDYQWYNNGSAIAGATNSSLLLDGIQFSNGGSYTVLVSNLFGSVTNPVQEVIVNPSGTSLGMYPGVKISGVVGYTYTVQSSTDLSNPSAWVTLTNITLTEPVQLFIDTNTDASLPGNPRRYYKVLPGQ